MEKILSVCISKEKGVPKKNIGNGIVRKNYGLVGDSHAGPGIRQISLLAKESLDEIRKKGMKVGCGGFGENFTTSGIELTSLAIGTKLKIGDTAVVKVTQIGKTCKKPCNIYKKQGVCILPSQGIFAKVLKGGIVKQGDKIEIVSDGKITAGVLIISDRSARGERKDESGDIISYVLKKIDGRIIRYKIVPDESELIISTLKNWSEKEKPDLIITSGGTGFSPRDVTPEATKKILQKEAPGLVELMRMKSGIKNERAYLSRGVAGIRNRTLIINLPGSPKAVEECLRIISPVLIHAIEVMRGEVKDCHSKINK